MKTILEERKIEASIVYLQSRGELLYADVSDEESSAPGPVFRDHVRAERAPDPMEDGDWVSLTGAVARISPGSFRLDTGRQEYTVDASGLAYDRFDPGSARRIRAGDRVIVFGAFEDGDLFERRQIEASTITKLSRAD